MRQILLFLLFPLILSQCQSGSPSDDGQYLQEMEAWHHNRVDQLKAPNGWLNLIGLYWLKPGENTFGSDKQNDIVFPAGKIPGKAGVIHLINGSVSIFPEKNVHFLMEGKTFSGGKFFPSDSSTAPYLSYQTLRFSVIRRNDRYGIRLRDDSMLENPNLEGLIRFPVDKNFKAEGFLINGTQNDSVDITNVLGQVIRQKSGGRFSFELFGQDLELTTIDEGGDELFIVFGDLTTGKESYGGGRFLYISKPDQDGKTVIDFNRAINPPCVFTEFATCPLPPAYNKLKLAIKAGEQDYHHPN